MKNLKTCVLATVLAGTAGLANADIFAPIQEQQQQDGLFVTADVTITSVGLNRYTVTISSNVNGGALVWLDSDDVNDVIQNITILPGCCGADQVTLTIRNNPGGLAQSSIQGIEKIEIFNPSSTYLRVFHIFIDGDLGTGDSSDTIEASKIDFIDISGDLLGNVIINDQALGNLSNTGDITIRGDVVGSGIYNNTGSIGLIEVWGDVVADGNDNPEFWSAADITIVDVWGDFAGRIGSNSEGFAGHPDVGEVLIGGNFIGSSAMTMNSLDTLFIGGDFDADVTVSSAMLATSVYDIGGTFAAAASLSLPTDGLVGQGIINSANASNNWLGNITIGSTTLAEDYITLSDELGGGAVGLAPYNFHQRETAPPQGVSRDCDPYQNETVSIAPLVPLDDVTISHYGPVYITGAGDHFRVEFRPDFAPFPQTPAWEDRTHLFEVDTAQTGTTPGTATNTAVIKATTSNREGFKASGRWRIRPLSGEVKCADAIGNPDVIYNSSVVSGDLGNTSSGTQYSWYAFRVLQEAPSGMTLLNGTNGPTAADIAQWLSTPYETNADGQTDIFDFIDMANEYQAD